MKRSAIYIVFLLMYCTLVQAQQYQFNTYNIEQGLPQSEVTDILRDKRGNLWVATNGGGVAQFNGTGFHVLNQQNGLIHNRVKKIYQSQSEDIWFITERGITKYNGKYFENFSQKDGFGDGIEFEVTETQGRVWFLIKKEKQNTKIVYWQDEQFKDFTLQYLQLTDYNQVIAIASEPSGGLLIQTQKEFFVYENEKLSIATSLNTLVLPFNFSTVYLYGNSKNGKPRLIVEKDNEITLYYYQQETLLSRCRIDKQKEEYFNYLTEDEKQNIWLSVVNKGLVKITQANEITTIGTANGLPVTMLASIFAEQDGSIWLGFLGGGLVRYLGDQFVLFGLENGLETGLVWAIHQDSKGQYWVGECGARGLVKFDGKKFSKIDFLDKPTPQKITVLTSLPDKSLIVGSAMGVWAFKGQEERLSNVSAKYGLKENINITSICPTSKGMWFGTFREGVFFYEYATKKTTSFTVKSHHIISDLVNDVMEDSKGNIWICTTYGISLITGLEIQTIYKKTTNSSSGYVLDAAEDKNGYVWVATFEGLLRFAPDRHTPKVFRVQEGLPTDYLYSVLVDANNNVWLGTQVGFACIALDSQSEPIKISNYNKNNGSGNWEGNEKAIYEDKNGDIWFGSVKGLLKYKKNAQNLLPKSFKVRIFEVNLYLQKTNWLLPAYEPYHDGLVEWTLIPKNLSLPYNKNYLSFYFEMEDYLIKSSSLQYQWRLEGLEKNWNEKSNKKEAIYTNLPPGKYTFLVRISTADGKKNRETTAYSFVIEPAFWQTWPFWTILIASIALVTIFLIRQRFLLIQNQKIVLQIKVAQASKALLDRNQELLEQKKEIENQKTDLQQLNATKDKFFSILAHDIKGPLNSLTAFLNIMTDHLEEMSQEDIRFMSSSLNKSVKNLYSLLENVLSWSRSQMGILEYNYQPLKLGEVIEETIQLLEVSAQAKGVKLESKWDKELWVWADKNCLQVVMRNLLSNAIKFSHIDGIVQVNLQVNSTETAEISVCDMGMGMSQEVMDKIFRIDARYTTKGTANEIGTGLGLVLVREFLEKNKGTISVESQEGKGSVFSVVLPLYKQPIDSNNINDKYTQKINK